MSTITSANSSLVLNAPDVFTTPLNVQGYATDDAFDTEMVDSAEAKMGVDGIMSAGYTPFITKQTIHLQADSPSVQYFDSILEAMEAAQEIFYVTVTIVLPATSRVYTFNKGVMTKAKKMPDAKKLLEPVAYEFSWESVSSANL